MSGVAIHLHVADLGALFGLSITHVIKNVK